MRDADFGIRNGEWLRSEARHPKLEGGAACHEPRPTNHETSATRKLSGQTKPTARNVMGWMLLESALP